MARFPKKRAANAPEPVRTIGWLVFGRTHSDPEATPIIEDVRATLERVLVDQDVFINGPTRMVERKPNASGEMTYRNVSMVGDERLMIKGVYYGSRDGFILQLQPCSPPLGLRPDDCIGMLLELPLSRHAVVRLPDGKLKELIDVQLPVEASFDDAITEMRQRAEQAERDRLLREAEVKIENYGTGWGAF